MRTDPEKVERIVLNLISNALKFTPQGGSILVEVAKQGQTLLLSVTDTGRGIAPEHLDGLFDRYSQVPGEFAGGTGLGLAIVREFSELLGGSAAVKSREGVGTTFTVTLPYTPGVCDDRSARAPGPHQTVVVPESGGVPPMVEQAPSSADQLGAIRVLVAEDNDDMRAYLQRVLGSLGPLLAVDNGLSAWEAVDSFKPDVIVSDVMMPKLDGLGLVRRLKQDPRTRPIPCILLTARAGKGATAAGLNVGADDYVCKPFAPEELRARVRSASRLHQTYQELADTKRRLERATSSLLHLEGLAVLGQRLVSALPELERGSDTGRRQLEEILAEARATGEASEPQ